MAKVTLSVEPYGCYEITSNTGESIFIQTDWDRPGLASNFGWAACGCGETDGTVDCPHKTATEMIESATDWLDSHDGESFDDPGYFLED